MAQRRMFSPEIVNSDAFLEMPPSTQALYFQLGMKADDDGFVNPKMVMRIMGSTEDELKVLIAKRFVLQFENGVVVLKHWRVNNLVRKDWYKPTIYTEQKAMLYVKPNGIYTLDKTQGVPLLTENRQQFVNEPLTQVRLGKNRLYNKQEFIIPDWIDKKVWADWENYRRAIKKKLTQASVNLQIKLLEAHKKDYKAIIERSIQNGWTGLFPLDGNDKKPTAKLKAPEGKYSKYGKQ
jgi:hypothetical protein